MFKDSQRLFTFGEWWDRQLVADRWAKLEEYLNVTEEYLQKAKDDFETWTDKEIKKLPPEQRDEFYTIDYVEEYFRYSEEFPGILRNSFLVSAYSLLEYEMGVICKKLKREQEIPIGWNELKGDMLERAKSYCKLAKLALSYEDSIWQEINYYSKVRNCIIHKSGLLKEFQHDKDLIDYVSRKGIISIKQEIVLTKEFCGEVSQTMQDFIEKVYSAYESQKKK